MTFFYPSIFSLILLSVIYTVIMLVLVGIHAYLVKRRKLAPRTALLRLAPLAIVFLLAPVAEELWIAWNFNRLCSKDAGIFIYEKVEVEGFYAETGGALDLVRPGNYRFIEYPHQGKTYHLEYGGEAFLSQVLARMKAGEGEREAEGVHRLQLDERTQALIFPEKSESWKITTIDRPTARYHYLEPGSHITVSHEIFKDEWIVLDKSSDQVLARETNYGRRAPWFFISLDRPVRICPTQHPLARYGAIYRQALPPIGAAATSR